MVIKIYVDGSAHPNPGPGGYGIVFFDENDNYMIHHSSQDENTTNNIQELKALTFAFLIANNYPNHDFIIYCDSNYAIKSLTEWAYDWEKNNWIKSDKKPVLNLEIIKAGFNAYKNLKNCKIEHIAGHKGIIGNELADALATNNINRFNKLLKEIL